MEVDATLDENKTEPSTASKKAFFVCFCGTFFKNQEKLDHHKEEKHNVKKRKCQNCDFESKHVQHINSHREKCKPENVEKCAYKLCDYKDSSQYRLYDHERKKHNINTRGSLIRKRFMKRNKQKRTSNGKYFFFLFRFYN